MAGDNTDRRTVGIGLLGSGTVGEAIQDILFKDPEGRIGRDLELRIHKIFTRNPGGKKWHSKRPALFTSNAEEVIDHPGVEIVVEALGFREARELERSRDLIMRALSRGKSVVTSNKAVLAAYGKEIWRAVEESGQELRFEACVGGGIPIIRSLAESFAVEEPQAVFGIVNGTCNFILTSMEKRSMPYAEALREAQSRGYAETNPSADVGGFDAEAKLILLAGVVFGLHAQSGSIWRKGIEVIQGIDFAYAARKGACTIKHLAVARRERGAIQAFVAPALVPRSHFLSGIDGATNAIFFKGTRSAAPPEEGSPADRDWDYVFAGPGAGGGATAVAILGDVCELARGRRVRATGLPSLVHEEHLAIQAADAIGGRFYLRFVVKDRAGIVGDIGRAFGDVGINIAEIWQLDHSRDELEGLRKSYGLKEDPQDILPFAITVERTTIGQIHQAIRVIRGQDYMLADPVWFPIWGAQ